MTKTTERTTTEKPWQWWLENAAHHRASAKRQYEEARLCDAWAKDTTSPSWAAIYRTWSDKHRANARWHQSVARDSIQHVKKLWPEAVNLDT